jgi:hypothetical protein
MGVRLLVGAQQEVSGTCLVPICNRAHELHGYRRGDGSFISPSRESEDIAQAW